LPARELRDLPRFLPAVRYASLPFSTSGHHLLAGFSHPVAGDVEMGQYFNQEVHFDINRFIVPEINFELKHRT
jgi:hypothetical protein